MVKLGSKATGFSLGDRVTFYFRGSGLQEYTTCPASRAFKIPDSVSTRDAAGISLQGLTGTNCPASLQTNAVTHWANASLIRLIHSIDLCSRGSSRPERWIYLGPCRRRRVRHDALPNVRCMKREGTSWATRTEFEDLGSLSHLGAHVIGTTSTEAKARIAKENGATDMVLYQGRDMKDVVSDIKKLTPGGEGVAAVFDGVGHVGLIVQKTSNFQWLGSREIGWIVKGELMGLMMNRIHGKVTLRWSKGEWNLYFIRHLEKVTDLCTLAEILSIHPRKGTIVCIGNASGPPPHFSVLKLMAKNLKCTEFTLG